MLLSSSYPPMTQIFNLFFNLYSIIIVLIRTFYEKISSPLLLDKRLFKSFHHTSLFVISFSLE
ncbi:hypothetical protein HMPREF9089_00507 [Eubacterium brachy ATCC 33089]|nr:hypothetical protein HMPREF9089_00507 [Eubacterium brachy ATCC 33089]